MHIVCLFSTDPQTGYSVSSYSISLQTHRLDTVSVLYLTADTQLHCYAWQATKIMNVELGSVWNLVIVFRAGAN